MTGRIADWTPDRPPTPDEVEDAYSVARMTPRILSELITFEEYKCGCAWGAITEAKRILSSSPSESRRDISEQLIIECGRENVVDFQYGFDNENYITNIDVEKLWIRAGVAAAQRMHPRCPMDS